MAEVETTSNLDYNIKILLKDEWAVIDTADVEQFYFIEDIFTYSMLGSFTFIDKSGMLEGMQFTGYEKISITFGIEDITSVEMVIHKIGNVTPMSSHGGSTISRVQLILVDNYYHNFLEKKISKSWNDQLISDIITDISDLVVGDGAVFNRLEATREKMSFQLPANWSMASAISFLKRRASGAISKNPGYCYYTDRDGQNLVTLDYLFSNTKIEKDVAGNPVIYRFMADEKLTGYNTILEWKNLSVDKSCLSSLKGAILNGFDPAKKKFLQVSINPKDIIKKLTGLVGNVLPIDPDSLDPTANSVETGETDETSMKNMYVHDFIRNLSRQISIEIKVKGHERRKIGSMIFIEWPSKDSKTEIVNKMMEGKYLIRSISHCFSPNMTPAYQQKITLLKNAYASNTAIDETGTKKILFDMKKELSGLKNLPVPNVNIPNVLGGLPLTQIQSAAAGMASNITATADTFLKNAQEQAGNLLNQTTGTIANLASQMESACDLSNLQNAIPTDLVPDLGNLNIESVAGALTTAGGIPCITDIIPNNIGELTAQMSGSLPGFTKALEGVTENIMEQTGNIVNKAMEDVGDVMKQSIPSMDQLHIPLPF